MAARRDHIGVHKRIFPVTGREGQIMRAWTVPSEHIEWYTRQDMRKLAILRCTRVWDDTHRPCRYKRNTRVRLDKAVTAHFETGDLCFAPVCRGYGGQRGPLTTVLLSVCSLGLGGTTQLSHNKAVLWPPSAPMEMLFAAFAYNVFRWLVPNQSLSADAMAQLLQPGRYLIGEACYPNEREGVFVDKEIWPGERQPPADG